MSESNTIVINTHPIKKITLCLESKEYEIPAYMSIDDLQLFYSEEKESKDYKRAISAVLLEKINVDGEVTNLEEIYKQDDVFFTEFIAAVIENDVHIAAIYADTSADLPEIERFGIAYEEYVRGMAKRIADAMKPLAEGYSQIVKSIDFSGAILSF